MKSIRDKIPEQRQAIRFFNLLAKETKQIPELEQNTLRQFTGAQLSQKNRQHRDQEV